MSNEIEFKGIHAAILIAAVMIIIVLFSGWYSVPEGHRGALFSKTTAWDYQEKAQGWGFKTPFIESVTDIDVRTQTIEMIGDKALTPKDKNGINFNQEVLVRFSMDPNQATEFLELKGKDPEPIVYTAMRGAARNIFGKYIQEEVPERRGDIAVEIKEELQKRLNEEKSGRLKDNYIIVEAVDVRNTGFNGQIEEAISRKQVQKQVAEQKQYELQAAQKQKEIIEVNAEAQKNKDILEAEGRGAAILIEATNKAEGLRMVNAAYQNMPMEYVLKSYADAIKPTDKIYFGMESLSGNMLPFLDINKVMSGTLKNQGVIS